MERYPVGKFHFQLGRQTPCKGTSDSKLFSHSSDLSWSVLWQLKIQEPPMEMSPKDNTATISLFMTSGTKEEQLFVCDTAYSDMTIIVMNETLWFVWPGHSLLFIHGQSQCSQAHSRRSWRWCLVNRGIEVYYAITHSTMSVELCAREHL